MGVYIFGIPVFENADEADARRNDRTRRKRIEEESDVEKKALAEESEQVRAETGTNVGGTVSGAFSGLGEVVTSNPLNTLAEGVAAGNVDISTPWGSIGGSPVGGGGGGSRQLMLLGAAAAVAVVAFVAYNARR
jgi:hypothetical protein